MPCVVRIMTDKMLAVVCMLLFSSPLNNNVYEVLDSNPSLAALLSTLQTRCSTFLHCYLVHWLTKANEELVIMTFVECTHQCIKL